jgi:hypothetical protein
MVFQRVKGGAEILPEILSTCPKLAEFWVKNM